MREFYRQVRVAPDSWRFSAGCSACGKIIPGPAAPLFCRGPRHLKKCEDGTAELLSQNIFNHAHANAVQTLALQFNRCGRCGSWVCDDCFDPDAPLGACANCAAGKGE